MRKFILAIPAKTVTDGFAAAVNTACTPLANFKVNLTDEEKAGMRTMAEGREGYARLISKVATQHPSALSRADSPAELANALDFQSNIQTARMAILMATEIIDELELANGTDIMTMVDRYNDNLQISRKNEASVDLAMREVDEWNSRFANKKESGTTPPAL